MHIKKTIVELYENGNKLPNVLVVIMNTGKVRAYDYNDTNSGETRKYMDITKDFFLRIFIPPGLTTLFDEGEEE